MSSNKAVANKIIEAWRLIGSIPKNGRNPKFNYAFVREEDAADAIRHAFIKVGLSLIPSVEKVERSVIKTSSGGEMQHVLITMRFTITDKDTGESDSFIMVGEAADSFDKATYKAITGCTKYAYTKLALSGAEDNEEDDAGPKEKKESSAKPVQQGATFKKEEKQPEKPKEEKAQPPQQPPQQQQQAPPPKQAQNGAPTYETVGKITAVIPAMRNKPATLTIKPNDGTQPAAINFDPKTINVPQLLQLQSGKADVKVVCDISSGTPVLTSITGA